MQQLYLISGKKSKKIFSEDISVQNVILSWGTKITICYLKRTSAQIVVQRLRNDFVQESIHFVQERIKTLGFIIIITNFASLKNRI